MSVKLILGVKDFKPIQIILLLLSASLFTLSLTQPAFRITEGDWGNSGFMLLAIGWMAPLGGAGAEGFVWLANPLYLLSGFYVLFGKRRAILFSILAALIALSFATWHSVMTSESGATADIIALSSGYYLWLASMVVMVVCTLSGMKQDADIKEAV
jgi:hypothetical protein